jgi:hypothetical protein
MTIQIAFIHKTQCSNQIVLYEVFVPSLGLGSVVVYNDENGKSNIKLSGIVLLGSLTVLSISQSSMKGGYFRVPCIVDVSQVLTVMLPLDVQVNQFKLPLIHSPLSLHTYNGKNRFMLSGGYVILSYGMLPRYLVWIRICMSGTRP